MGDRSVHSITHDHGSQSAAKPSHSFLEHQIPMSMKMIARLTMEHFDQHRDGNLRHITNMRHRQK
jgi:hypothetical protein